MDEPVEIVWLRSADDDVQQAYNRFEDRWPGFGNSFLLAVEAVLERLKFHPEIGTIAKGDVRRVLVPDFSFGVYYQFTGGRIMINSVLNLRQNPELLQRRLDDLL